MDPSTSAIVNVKPRIRMTRKRIVLSQPRLVRLYVIIANLLSVRNPFHNRSFPYCIARADFKMKQVERYQPAAWQRITNTGTGSIPH